MGLWVWTVLLVTTLIGGAGNDTLHGGAGADIFVLNQSGADTIVAFESGVDKLNLSEFRGLLADNGEKTPLDPPILPTDEHTIDGATPSPLPQPSIVLNTPTNPEVQPETNTDKPNNQGDIVSMLDRWLKS